jgi:ankyrin repeat protein
MPLHWAAHEGHVEAIRMLVQTRRRWTAVEHTPLHSAAQQGHGRAVEALVQLGAQVDTHAAAAGVTPLQLSVRVGHHQAAQVLRQLEASIARTQQAAEQADRTAAGHGSW